MLLSLLVSILVSNAATLRQDLSVLFSRNAVKTLLLISLIGYSGLYIYPLDKGIGVYGGLFNITTFTQSFNIFIVVISAAILLLTSFFPRKIQIKEISSLYNLVLKKLWYDKNLISGRVGEQFRIIEYSLIIVFIICGAVFLMSTGDLISIFLSIELQSYGLYILASIYRNSESSTASGLTYFLLGGLSSCFILLGSSLIYANSGLSNLDNIYIITSITDISLNTDNNNAINFYNPYYIYLSFIILCVGFLFKISAAPFHFWSPDVYDGIPTIVTTYVAIIAKISIFVFLLEIVYYTNYYYFDFFFTGSPKNIFLLSSLFSLIVGSILGLTQTRIKRLFAYSTISHVGFILLALSINTTESIQSYIFYILQYTISNLSVFIIIITIGYSLHFYVYNNENTKKEKLIDVNNSPIQLINQIKGYFYINPFIAISLSITLFSFVGIPPIIGFFAKQMILSAALDSGYIFITLIAILTSVIGAGYYLNLIKQIFFFKSDYTENSNMHELSLNSYSSSRTTLIGNILPLKLSKPFKFTLNNITISSSLSTSISILTMLLLLFIYTPDAWFNIVTILSLIIFKT
jgi:NADH-ubiquinone oxidoreductase chain 2